MEERIEIKISKLLIEDYYLWLLNNSNPHLDLVNASLAITLMKGQSKTGEFKKTKFKKELYKFLTERGLSSGLVRSSVYRYLLHVGFTESNARMYCEKSAIKREKDNVIQKK